MSYSNTSEKLSILTSKGDLLVNNGSSVVRFPSGSNGQIVLAQSSASSGLSWAAAPVASGNVFEIATTTLTAAAASIEFSSLTASGSTKDLGFIFTGWNTTSETSYSTIIYIQLNGETSGVYDWRAVRNQLDNPQLNTQNFESGDFQIRSGFLIGKSSANIGPSCMEGTIRDGMLFYRGGSSSISATNGGNNTTNFWGGGGNGQQTIHTIKFFPGSGAFAEGTSITIYRTTQA